jgi:zinc protease
MTTDVQRGLAPVSRRLDNGALVIVKESRVTPAVTISVSVPAGTVADPRDLPGVSSFLSRVIDRGTEAHTADEIAEALDGRGVTLTATAMRHAFVVACTCLAEDFSALLDLVGEVVRQPSLPDGEIATRRGEIVTAIRQDQDNPAMVAIEEDLALLYPNGHPYGCRMKGTIESVERIDRLALVRMHRDRFGPSSLVVVVVGDVDTARALEQTARVFGDWAGRSESPAPVPPPPRVEARRQSVVPMNKAQADIAYGFNTIARNDPAYYALALMNNVLGQYALGGRLGDNIRERQGMAYYVFSAFEPNVGESPLVVRAGVGPGNVDRTLAAIDEELRHMARDGVTARELEASKKYLISSMPRTLETNAGIATFLQTCAQFGLGLDYDLRLPGLLSAVTVEEASEMARRFLVPERATIVVAGPYSRD